MKKLLLLFLFIPFVFAMRGGETQRILTIDGCVGDVIDITVSAWENINDNEYNFSNCNKTSNTVWECPCEDPFDITLNVRQNTINTYIINVEYDVENPDTGGDGDDSSGSRSGGGIPYTRDDGTVINENEMLDNKTKRKSEEVIAGGNLPEPTKPINETSPEEKKDASLPDVPKGTGGIILVVGAIVLVILGGAGILFYKVFFDTTSDGDFDEDDVENIVYDIEEEDRLISDKVVSKKIPKIIKKEINIEDVDDILKHLDD